MDNSHELGTALFFDPTGCLVAEGVVDVHFRQVSMGEDKVVDPIGGFGHVAFSLFRFGKPKPSIAQPVIVHDVNDPNQLFGRLPLGDRPNGLFLAFHFWFDVAVKPMVSTIWRIGPRNANAEVLDDVPAGKLTLDGGDVCRGDWTKREAFCVQDRCLYVQRHVERGTGD